MAQTDKIDRYRYLTKYREMDWKYSWSVLSKTTECQLSPGYPCVWIASSMGGTPTTDPLLFAIVKAGSAQQTDRQVFACCFPWQPFRKRALDAWQTLEPVFRRITGEDLNDTVKIFGLIGNFNKCLYWFSNVLVQIMQRSIWQTRKIYEKSNIEHNLWKYFRKKVNVIVNRAFLFQGDNFLEELCQYIPVRNIMVICAWILVFEFW